MNLYIFTNCTSESPALGSLHFKGASGDTGCSSPLFRSLPQSGVFERQVGIPAFQSTGRSWWQTESQPLAREKDLARDIAFEHHLHFSEILPLFPRSLLTLRNHSCWRCLVPPPCITLQRGCHDDKVLRPRCRPIPFPRVSFGAHL